MEKKYFFFFVSILLFLFIVTGLHTHFFDISILKLETPIYGEDESFHYFFLHLTWKLEGVINIQGKIILYI